jgi:translocation and assembly module TamB
LIATAGSAGIQVSANAQQKQRRLLDATASLNAAIGNLKSIEAVAGAPLSVKVTLGPMTMDEIRRLTGSAPDPGTSPVNGLLHADLTLSGSLNDPRLNLRSEVDRLSAEGMGLGKADLEYSYASTRSDLSADVATTGGKLEIKGNTRLDLSYPSIRKGLDYGAAPLDVGLRADGFDLGFLSGISPTVRTIGGKLRANAAIQGTVALPKIQGQLEWIQGRLALLGYGEYQGIHLQVEGTDQTIHLKELLVRSGGGQLKLTADADRRGNRLSLTGKANLDKFPVISDDQLVASVSMRADMEGEITPQLIKVGRLHIPEAHVELPDTKRKSLQSMELPDDIVLVRNGKPLKKGDLKNTGLGGAGEVGSTPAQGARQISIVIDAPRNLWVKGNDLNVEVGLSEGFQVEVAQSAAIFGEVNVFRGRVDVWGRRFDVQKNSTVRFSGQPLDPNVNVTVLHNNEKEQVKVTITVSGQGKDLKIVASSDPPLSDTEIYTLIATGRRTLKRNSGAIASTSGSSQAASVVGSLAATELKNAVASKLPLDVLSIQAGDTGFGGTKLEAGTYVTDQIYIGYTGRIGARPEYGENSNAVRVEYQITPRWSLEGEYGDAKAGSADLIWSRDY